MSSYIPFPIDFSKVLFSPDSKSKQDSEGYTSGVMSIKVPVRYKKRNGKYQYKFQKEIDENSDKDSDKEKSDEPKFEAYKTSKKSKKDAGQKMPSKNWRKEWDIAEEDLPLGAHIYEGVTAFDLEELRTEMTGLRIVPPSAKAEKGAEETKPHFESALEKEQIKGWLEEWEPYDHRIHFYPYDMNSKNKVNGKLMDNWIDLHLTKNEDMVKGDWFCGETGPMKSARAHFKNWVLKTEFPAKKTDSPYEVGRVYVRQEGKIFSFPLGAIYIRLVRHKATPNRKLQSLKEKNDGKNAEKADKSDAEGERSDDDRTDYERDTDVEEDQPVSKKTKTDKFQFTKSTA